MTILPSPTFPLAVQSRFGQNTCDAFICSVLCLFISTAYKRMLSFSIHPDFCPPVNGVLPIKKAVVTTCVFIRSSMALRAREGNENRVFHVSAAFVGGFRRKPDVAAQHAYPTGCATS